MGNRHNETNSRRQTVLAFLMAFATALLSACSLPDSKSANDGVMRVVSHNDRQPSDGWPQKDCGYVRDVTGVKFCFYRTLPETPQYTIWFFHGAGDSERVFETSPFDQSSYIELAGALPSVNIVTISYGPIWALTSTDDTGIARMLEPKQATVPVFTDRIVPYIEKRFGPAPTYVAMGHSQGGLNVATLCASRPSMWSACVLLNPMLPSCDPFKAWPICPPLFTPTLLSPVFYSGPNLLVRVNFYENEWRRAEPIALLNQRRGTLPPSFVTACPKDEFGLYTGPKAWQARANELWSNSTWVDGVAECDHFRWPAPYVLDFLNKNVPKRPTTL
jgi:pimeloyl-ACP methyl ester carboxylesterase